jgi:hypothetical protein
MADVPIGDMPLTFLRHFCIGSQLRWMVSSFTWPDNDYFRRLADDYRQRFGNLVYAIPSFDQLLTQSSQPSLYDAGKTRRLDQDIYNRLLDKINSYSAKKFASALNLSVDFCDAPMLHTDAQLLQKVEYQSVTFGMRGRTARNSFILFKKSTPQQNLTSVSAGQIVDIFRHARHDGEAMRVEDFCVVEAFQPLEGQHADLDPFRKFPDIEAQLYYRKAEVNQDGTPRLHILCITEIVSHFAAFVYIPPGIDEECILALSLDRVSLTLMPTTHSDQNTLRRRDEYWMLAYIVWPCGKTHSFILNVIAL